MRVDFTICGLFQTRNSLSVASVQTKRPISDASSRSLLSVATARPKSSESTASTGTTNGNGNSNGNSNGNGPLVGGTVAGGIVMIVLVLIIGVFLYRRNRGAPPIPRRPFISQQPSSQPITPASLTFSMNSNDIGGCPVTNTAQPGWNAQQITPFTLFGGPPAAGQPSTAPQQYASTRVKKWAQRAPDIQQSNYRGPVFQSLPAGGLVEPTELHDNSPLGPTHYVTAPVTVPYSASDAPEGTTSPPPRYSNAPPVSEKAGLLVMNV